MTSQGNLEAGTVFAGEFRVERPLKEGGMGSVYVAVQLSTAKRRALKIMDRSIAHRADFRKRFELEARIGAQIKSDHVVEVIASGVDAETQSPWIAMELLEGDDLAGCLRDRGCFSTAEVYEIMGQLCHALGEAHAQNIVHRDLKPENVFMAGPRRRGVPFTVKVLDFGIARIVAEARATSVATPATKAQLGTPLYMAPEQAEPNKPITPATDVWALGLIAFQLLTGYLFWKSAYDDGASLMMLATEAFGLPMPPASHRARELGFQGQLPPGFDDWFARCVARDPAARFPDATAAFTAIDPLLGGAPSSAQPFGHAFAALPTAVSPQYPDRGSSAPGPIAPPPADPIARRALPILLIALGGAALLFSVAVIVVLFSVFGEPSTGPPARRKTPVPTAPPPPPPKAATASDCDEYLRLLECSLRAAKPEVREAALAKARAEIKASYRAAAAAKCKQLTRTLRDSLRGSSCVR